MRSVIIVEWRRIGVDHSAIDDDHRLGSDQFLDVLIAGKMVGVFVRDLCWVEKGSFEFGFTIKMFQNEMLPYRTWLEYIWFVDIGIWGNAVGHRQRPEEYSRGLWTLQRNMCCRGILALGSDSGAQDSELFCWCRLRLDFGRDRSSWASRRKSASEFDWHCSECVYAAVRVWGSSWLASVSWTLVSRNLLLGNWWIFLSELESPTLMEYRTTVVWAMISTWTQIEDSVLLVR